MKQLILLFILIPTLVFSQKISYKTYDKAVKYFNEGKNEKAKQLIVKILNKNAEWNQPNLLMASIFANEGNVNKSALFLLMKAVEPEILCAFCKFGKTGLINTIIFLK